MNIDLPLILKVAGAGQVLVAGLNLALVPMMQWRESLLKIPLLIREVFQVHLWFISVTLLIFGVLTWRFSPEMAGGTHAMGAWLCAGIGFFWTLRTLLQVVYYSSSHWRGQPRRIAIHLCLIVAYGVLGAAYLFAAARYF